MAAVPDQFVSRPWSVRRQGYCWNFACRHELDEKCTSTPPEELQGLVPWAVSESRVSEWPQICSVEEPQKPSRRRGADAPQGKQCVCQGILPMYSSFNLSEGGGLISQMAGLNRTYSMERRCCKISPSLSTIFHLFSFVCITILLILPFVVKTFRSSNMPQDCSPDSRR